MIAELSLPMAGPLSPEDIVREVRHLPSAPKVLPRLKQLLSDANSAMHEIVALIRLDPGIAARVLQVGNSAYFSKGVRCFTVDEAVNRVGYDQIYDLVSFAVASQVLVRPLVVYEIEADDLWRKSVASALAAELLATRTNQDRNVAYTVGLLHAVGMVAIDEWAAKHSPALRLKNAGFPREAGEAERAALGFTQAETGCALLKHWGFPYSISEPVRWQYVPRASAGQAKMASLLFAAKWLALAACQPPGVKLPPRPDPVQLNLLGLAPDKLEKMAQEVVVRMSEVSSLLDAGTGANVDRSQFPARDWEV